MKKLFGVFAIASVLSLVLMGCTPPAEGDTAPPNEPAKSDTTKADESKAGNTGPKTETPATTAN